MPSKMGSQLLVTTYFLLWFEHTERLSWQCPLHIEYKMLAEFSLTWQWDRASKENCVSINVMKVDMARQRQGPFSATLLSKQL